MEDYSEYIIQGEPDKGERVRNWMAAIGLQEVDDLKPSQYLLDTVRQNIEGKVTLEEVRRLVDQYYITKEGLQQEKRTEEAGQESTQEKAGSTQESTQETNKCTQEMILDEIRMHPFTTREQLAKIVGITPDGIKKQLEKLKKAKVIAHVGPTKGGHWEIKGQRANGAAPLDPIEHMEGESAEGKVK